VSRRTASSDALEGLGCHLTSRGAGRRSRVAPGPAPGCSRCFDQTSWICPACSVGISVPKSSPTSSYLSPRHFIAASIMSGSWPTILLGLFGSRYMTGGSVGSRPTLRVFPASPGYLVATLSGSHAACAGCAPNPRITATSSPITTAPLLYLIPKPPFLTRSSALQSRALGARVAPMAQEMSPAATWPSNCPSRAMTSPRARVQHEQPSEREAVERVVARPRVQPPLVYHPSARRIEQDEIASLPTAIVPSAGRARRCGRGWSRRRPTKVCSGIRPLLTPSE